MHNSIFSFFDLLLFQDIPPVKSSIANSSSCAPPMLNLSDPGKFPLSPSLPYPLHLTPAEHRHHHQKGNPLSRRCACMCQCLHMHTELLYILHVFMNCKYNFSLYSNYIIMIHKYLLVCRCLCMCKPVLHYFVFRDSPQCIAQRESPFGAAAVLLSTRQPPRPSPHKPMIPIPSGAHQVTGITPRTK